MTTFIATCLLLGQEFSAPQKWMLLEPKATVSSDWTKRRLQMEAKMKELSGSSKEVRIKKWEQLANEVASQYSPSDTAAYECSWSMATFVPELFNNDQGTAMRRAIWQTKGSNDPEFMRVAYSALSVQRSPGNWGTLGIKLLRIFPKDTLLKKGFVNDAIFGTLSIEHQYQARTILNRDLKSVYSEYAFVDLSAEFENRLYWSTQKKVHLDLAVQNLSAFIKMAKSENRPTAQAEAVLRVLQKRLTQKKYID